MQDTPIVQEKKLAREKARLIRRKLHKKYCHTASKQLLNFVPDILEKFGRSIVAGFLPIQTEINIIPLLHELVTEQCQLCLPVTPMEPGCLLFRTFSFGQKLELGPYNTKHPYEGSFQVFPDLVLMPLLTFDKNYYRLGYGGGFYDRTISKFRTTEQKACFVGVAYSGQAVDKVPIASTDEPMDGMLTPSGLILR